MDWVGRDGLQRALFLIGGKVLVKDCWLHRRSRIQTNSLDLFLSSVFSVWAIASPVLQTGRESNVSSQQPTRQRRERHKNMTDVYLRPDMGTVQSTLVSFDSRGIPILASRHIIDIVFILVGEPHEYARAFAVHKELICRASAVMKAHFEQDPDDNLVELGRDYHPNTFSVLYMWLYTGKLVVPEVGVEIPETRTAMMRLLREVRRLCQELGVHRLGRRVEQEIWILELIRGGICRRLGVGWRWR